MDIFKTTRVISFGLAALCLAALLALAGCAPQGNPATEAQTANRQYMARVNQTMDDLSQKLEGFEEAVSRGDVVTMRTQADNALKTLDALAAIEAPEALKDVQQDYVDGCGLLKDALDGYIALYTEVASATDEHPFDYGTYDARVEEIQGTYDRGIDKLKAGDALAAEL